jgi:hypothetical protein
VGRHGAQVVERQGGRVLHGAADLERAVVFGDREVAADVVEVGRRELAVQRVRRCLRVEWDRVDHLQRGTIASELVC